MIQRLNDSIDIGGRLEIDLLPFSGNDSLTNLCCGLVLLGHLIRIIEFSEANGALRAVGAFKATVQALVSHAVAITVARLLINYALDFGRQFISVRLIWKLVVSSPKLIAGKDCW